MDQPKRKLPLLQSSPREDEGEPRPPWHWIGFCTVAIFGAWMPLALLGQAIASRLSRLPASDSPADAAASFYALSASERAREIVALALPHVLALGAAAFAGGFLVGRFGEGAGRREAALGGLMAGIVSLVLAFASGGISWPPLVVVALATGFSAWGGARGVRSRKPQSR